MIGEREKHTDLITFYIEDWHSYRYDISLPALWAEHYGELAGDPDRMPMGPDDNFYASLELAGSLQITTARQRGKLVGYVLCAIRPHPHYRSILCSFEDAYFLTKSCRRGLIGYKLLRFTERALAARGVKKAFFMTKLSKDLLDLFTRLGYNESDRMVEKWIGD